MSSINNDMQNVHLLAFMICELSKIALKHNEGTARVYKHHLRTSWTIFQEDQDTTKLCIVDIIIGVWEAAWSFEMF